MRLLNPSSGFILCAFCGDAADKMSEHLDTAHTKELTVINSNYQAPGNPVSRWIFEVRNLPVPPKLVFPAAATHDVLRNTLADSSTPTAPSSCPRKSLEREEAICLECCKAVDNRERHLFVYHVRRPIVKCPLCAFSSNFDALKVQAHIAETHSELKEPLSEIDQSHLYKDEIAEWEQRCYVTGPPTLQPAEEIKNVSFESKSSNGEEITNKKSLQADECAPLSPLESIPSLTQQDICEKGSNERQESAEQKEITEASSQSPMESPAAEKIAPSKPEVIGERKRGSNGAEKIALPTRFPAKCELCACQTLGDVNEFKRHVDVCRAARPFLCIHCPRRFKRQSDCTLHRRCVHEKKEPPHSVPAPAAAVDLNSVLMDAPSSPIKTSRKKGNGKGSTSSSARVAVNSTAKLKTTRDDISSSLVASTADRKGVPVLEDSQDVSSVKATSENSNRKREKEELTPVSPARPSLPLALRKGRRQRSWRATAAADDDFEELDGGENELAVEEQPVAEKKRKGRQTVRSTAAQALPSTATANAKRKAKDVIKEATQPRKEPKNEDTVVKRKPSPAVASVEPKAMRSGRLRSSATEHGYASSAAMQSSSSPAFNTSRQLPIIEGNVFYC
uniref:C2H2-type domain-containing protein n=1 Tax=Plectus sambesii TaxID=2011161 RepID=A0A914X6V0_9BILA